MIIMTNNKITPVKPGLFLQDILYASQHVCVCACSHFSVCVCTCVCVCIRVCVSQFSFQYRKAALCIVFQT